MWLTNVKSALLYDRALRPLAHRCRDSNREQTSSGYAQIKNLINGVHTKLASHRQDGQGLRVPLLVRVFHEKGGISYDLPYDFKFIPREGQLSLVLPVRRSDP